MPATADSERSPAWPSPNTFAHTHPSTKNSGGFGSCAIHDESIPPNDRCISCTAWASSNQ